VEIVWNDNAIKNQWLQVTVKSDTNTGLPVDDVFYFGNAVGKSGDNLANAVVNAQDEINSRTNKTGFSSAGIANRYDYNRDNRVNATDDLIARHNRTDGSGATPLQLIFAPAASSAPAAASGALQALLATAADVAAFQSATFFEGSATLQSTAVEVELAIMQPMSAATDVLIYHPATASAEAASAKTMSVLPIIAPARALSASAVSQPTRRNNAPYNPTPTLQDRLYDAVFSYPIARYSLTEYDLPDDSAASADIEPLLRARLAGNAYKQLKLSKSKCG
jgi:hypothetical protein